MSSRRRRRAAFTLVELTVVIALSSVVLGSVGVLLQGAWRVEQSAVDHRTLLNSLTRLSQQFRSDIHTAVAVEVLALDPEVVATQAASSPAAQDAQHSRSKFRLVATLAGDRQIEYLVDDSGLNRIVRSSDRITQRETYKLPPDARVGWQVDSPQASGSAGRLASLLISYQAPNKNIDGADGRRLRVDAVVGLSPETVHLAESGQ